MKIVISEFMDNIAVDSLSKKFSVEYLPSLVDNLAELKNKVSNASAIIVRNRTQVNCELLAAAPKLKVVGRLGVGLDNIDLEACDTKNVKVIPAINANDNAVAEYVLCTAMILLRQAYQSNNGIIEGKWPRQDCIGHEIAGKSIGFIGFGSIAMKTAKKAHALGMQIMAYDPYINQNNNAFYGVVYTKSLSDLLKQADVISLHTPLTAGTKNLINADAIAQMKKGAIFINSARGGIVDESALALALKNKKIAGAALDVFANEPVNKDSGSMFNKLDNILLTPHIAGVTHESNVRVSNLIAKEVAAVLE